MVGTDLGGHRKPPFFGLADQRHAARGAEVGHVEPSASRPGQGDIPGYHGFFRRRWDAVQAQVGRHRTFSHDPVARQRLVLAVVADGQAQVQAVDQGQAHQIGVVHRVAVIAESHHTGAGQFFHLRQFVTLALLGDTADRQYADQRILAGFLLDEFDHRGVVDGRVGVGHGAEGGKPALGRGLGAGGDGLFILEARFPKMAVQVDEPRAGHKAGAVNDLAAVGDAVNPQPTGGDDLPVAKQDVAYPVQLPAGVDYPGVANHYVFRFHTPLPRAELRLNPGIFTLDFLAGSDGQLVKQRHTHGDSVGHLVFDH